MPGSTIRTPAQVAGPPLTAPAPATTPATPTHVKAETPAKPTILAAPSVKRHVVHEKPPAVEAPAAARTFELAPQPKAVTVFLDGKRLGEYGPQLQQLLVPGGRHTVRFESPYCFPKDVDIPDNEPGGRLGARLRWKPARLTVKSDPDSADVLVDGSI